MILRTLVWEWNIFFWLPPFHGFPFGVLLREDFQDPMEVMERGDRESFERAHAAKRATMDPPTN